MGLAGWTPQPDYCSETDDLVDALYLPAISESVRYDRLTGYFSSSVFTLTWVGVVDFVDRGGRMRIICSPALSIADGESLVSGYQAHDDEELSAQLAAELAGLMAHDSMRAPAVALAGLISAGVIDLRLGTVSRTASQRTKRMFHDKTGLFFDDQGDVLGFRGSANETYLGLAPEGNVESIDVFPSWCDGRDAQRVERARHRFESLWANNEPGVTVRPIPEDLADRLRVMAESQSWRDSIAEILDSEEAAERSHAASPSGRILRRHQVKALDKWEASGRRGILELATGAGKTLVGIAAIGRHIEERNPAVVIVPSSLLLGQWVEELQLELGATGVKVHACGDGGSAWKELLRDWVTDDETPRVVVAITNTAASSAFVAQAAHARNLLLVADEVHRLGAARNRNILTLDATARLGLSATPERAGDPEGTAALMEYFGGVIERFTLSDAIAAGFLTPYLYEAHSVRLTEDEQEQWAELSKKIRRQVAMSRQEDGPPSRSLKQLQIKRARISKQAAGKVSLARQLVKSKFNDGQRWLVYCDDLAQLDAVVGELSAEGLPVTSYHSQMAGDAEATLRHFEVNGGVVVSIKCLDEGVDIPAATHALILASSRNRREFIQRRGRVLRKSPGKTLAHVFDAITLPEGHLDRDTDSLVWGEIARAAEFAAGAVNASNPRHALEQMCLDVGIDLTLLYEAMQQAALAGYEVEDESPEDG